MWQKSRCVRDTTWVHAGQIEDKQSCNRVCRAVDLLAALSPNCSPAALCSWTERSQFAGGPYITTAVSSPPPRLSPPICSPLLPTPSPRLHTSLRLALSPFFTVVTLHLAPCSCVLTLWRSMVNNSLDIYWFLRTCARSGGREQWGVFLPTLCAAKANGPHWMNLLSSACFQALLSISIKFERKLCWNVDCS